MPTATVTVRELKNKESGIDLNIPNYKEIKGLLGGSVEYNIVVVSNLSFFKSPKHKDTDTVQFMITKKYGEFEDFYKRLNTKFSGTAFPPLPRKAFLMNDAVIKERRNALEHILKFIAVVPKIVTSPILLEFLGVNAIKAGKFRKDDNPDNPDKEKEDEEGEEKETTEEESNEQTDEHASSDVFNIQEEGDSELFLKDDEDELEADMFSETTTTNTDNNTDIFGGPDLGGGLEDGEGEELFLPGAVVEKTVQSVTESNEDSETSDLLRIEDDLDKLLQVKSKKAEADAVKDQSKVEVVKPKPVPAPRTLKPKPVSKKPEIPSKPKPVSSKPPVPGNKPKPPLPVKPGQKGDNSKVPKKTATNEQSSEEISNDDIMKYISENSSADADLDLF